MLSSALRPRFLTPSDPTPPHPSPTHPTRGPGFSDGASYALSLGLANGDLFTHVLGFSPGFMRVPRHVGRPPNLSCCCVRPAWCAVHLWGAAALRMWDAAVLQGACVARRCAYACACVCPGRAPAWAPHTVQTLPPPLGPLQVGSPALFMSHGVRDEVVPIGVRVGRG
jgi:predicted esterase